MMTFWTKNKWVSINLSTTETSLILLNSSCNLSLLVSMISARLSYRSSTLWCISSLVFSSSIIPTNLLDYWSSPRGTGCILPGSSLPGFVGCQVSGSVPGTAGFILPCTLIGCCFAGSSGWTNLGFDWCTSSEFGSKVVSTELFWYN